MSRKVTLEEIRAHFGVSFEYDHCVNLLCCLPENKNHLQGSVDWANKEIKTINMVLDELDGRQDESISKLLIDAVEILEALIDGI